MTLLFAISKRVLTILKEYGQYALSLGQSFSWRAQKHSLHNKTQVNPTYFYPLALRWFSRLLYTCQNQCNKKV